MISSDLFTTDAAPAPTPAITAFSTSFAFLKMPGDELRWLRDPDLFRLDAALLDPVFAPDALFLAAKLPGAFALFLLALVLLVCFCPPDAFPDNLAEPLDPAPFLAELAAPFREELADPFPDEREDFFDELPRAFFAGMCFSSYVSARRNRACGFNGPFPVIAKYSIPGSVTSNGYAINELPGSA